MHAGEVVTDVRTSEGDGACLRTGPAPPDWEWRFMIHSLMLFGERDKPGFLRGEPGLTDCFISRRGGICVHVLFVSNDEAPYEAQFRVLGSQLS
ncbi:hypothetical protein C0Q92_01795 [Streptomyces albidoflavus]|uniref:Uncharacterized protein n=1 Tax=Streptomyces albidoflavus TaxID=1886 RepID=A0A8G2E3N1_9ACTN|nr:hypothetical protein ADL32_08365 [Streptomyces albidoflavus]RZE29136.1 hypothetical protein C0Q92_01795 [Streptomyces albidoflavus]RZE49374.1 hypothetical protein C0Q95_01080 [Streptomyces albidoflavus]